MGVVSVNSHRAAFDRQMERQIRMQLLMRERMVATQLAVVREAIYWWGGFYGLCLVGLTAGFLKTKNPGVIAPLVPLSFVVGYQADMAFGNKMERIVGKLLICACDCER